MKLNFGKLLLIFTVIPFIELTLLLEIANRTSALTTLALILTTGVIGAYYAKAQGRQAIRAIQNELALGRMPAQELVHGLCVLVGGVLLITPGILTDLFGLSLLMPATRAYYTQFIQNLLLKNIRVSGVHMHTSQNREYNTWY